MKTVLSFLLALFLITPAHAVEVRSYAGSVLGHSNKVQCGGSNACAVEGGVLKLKSGVQNQVTGTTTTLTDSQCGATIVCDGADVLTLPLISSANNGCRFTFVVGEVANCDVNPNDANAIKLLTDAAGDAIRADAIGESVVLEAVGTSYWVPVGSEKGTWSDVN